MTAVTTRIDPQSIPVIADQTIRNFALFEAFTAAKAWGLTLVDRSASEDLKAWAASRGFSIYERHFLVENRRPYANLVVIDSNGREITILSYRDLTDEEIAELSPSVSALGR